jgi:hypothetical protein
MHIRYTKIFSVQFRGNIFIVYNLHIEKKWGIAEGGEKNWARGLGVA